MCIAFGPGKDMFDSTRIIGEKQYAKGKVGMKDILCYGNTDHT